MTDITRRSAMAAAAALPATTMEGISLKLELLLEWIEMGDSPRNERLVEVLQADIKRLGGLS
jgi:hypothetical protein